MTDLPSATRLAQALTCVASELDDIGAQADTITLHRRGAIDIHVPDADTLDRVAAHFQIGQRRTAYGTLRQPGATAAGTWEGVALRIHAPAAAAQDAGQGAA